MEIGKKKTVMHDKLIEILEPMLTARGFELVDLDFHRGKTVVVRLFIDRPRSQTGVSVDDCATVSRLLGPALEVEEVIAGAYTLEVSSPGVERPLTKGEHFVRFRGEKARLTTYEPVDGKTFFSGIIGDADDGSVTIDVDGERIEVLYHNVKKANLEFDFGKARS